MEIVQETTKSEISCRTGIYLKSDLSFHWHENVEICRILNKPCRFRIDGEIIYANPGDIITIGEQVIHQFLIDEDDTQIQIFQFFPKILLNISYGILPLKTHITAEETAKSPELKGNIDALFSMLAHEHRAKTAEENPFACSLAVSLYLFLQKNFPSEIEFSRAKSDRSDFYKIADYINEHFCEDINVNSISKEFFISRTKLSRIFKKYSGTGINEYLNTLRIKNANYLIENGTSITDAALSSGFSSIRTFNNVYKIIMKTTPSEHLKKQIKI